MLRRLPLVALALAALGFGSTATGLPPAEGHLSLVVYPGYAETGANDPSANWVAPFVAATGCRVSVRVVHGADELLAAVARGHFDGVLSGGDVSRVLIGGRMVAPLDRRLIPRLARVYPALRRLPEGRYAVPHDRQAPVLLWRTDVVHRPPTTASLWTARYGPHVGVYGSPMQIAQAAIALGYPDPYELDHAQFLAAVRLAARQSAEVGSYFQDEVKALADFTGGNAVVGLVPPRVRNLLRRDQVPVADRAVGGVTGRIDVWMLLRGAAHPGCMYRWLDYILSPRANAASARYLGAAPATPDACAYMDCAAVHAGDERYWSRIAFWRTPQRDCGDARGRVCADWFDWSDAWDAIRG